MYASLSVIIEVFSAASVYGEAVCSADTAIVNKASSATEPDALRENSRVLNGFSDSRDTSPREPGLQREKNYFLRYFEAPRTALINLRT